MTRLPNGRHASPQETGRDPHDRSVTPRAVASALRSSTRNRARFTWPKKDVTGNGVPPLDVLDRRAPQQGIGRDQLDH